jgi:hypothetical protein
MIWVSFMFLAFIVFWDVVEPYAEQEDGRHHDDDDDDPPVSHELLLGGHHADQRALSAVRVARVPERSGELEPGAALVVRAEVRADAVVLGDLGDDRARALRTLLALEDVREVADDQGEDDRFRPSPCDRGSEPRIRCPPGPSGGMVSECM